VKIIAIEPINLVLQIILIVVLGIGFWYSYKIWDGEKIESGDFPIFIGLTSAFISSIIDLIFVTIMELTEAAIIVTILYLIAFGLIVLGVYFISITQFGARVG